MNYVHRFLVLDTGYSVPIAGLLYFCWVLATELQFLRSSTSSSMKVKITLSPCTTWRRMRRGDIAPVIPSLGTGWRWMINWRPDRLVPTKELRCALNRKLHGSRVRSGSFKEDKSLLPKLQLLYRLDHPGPQFVGFSPIYPQQTIEQCFSTFIRPRPGKFFFHKTRARSQQIYS